MTSADRKVLGHFIGDKSGDQSAELMTAVFEVSRGVVGGGVRQKCVVTVCMVPIGKVLFWFGFMWSGVFSVVCIFLPKKYKPLKALNFYSSAKLRFQVDSRCSHCKYL